MKKANTFILRLIMLLSCTVISANVSSAYDFMVDDIAYNIEGDAVVVTYDGETTYHGTYQGVTNVVIPETVTHEGRTFQVTGIGKYAFYRSYQLVSVTLPSTIETIGVYAFHDCWALTSIVIPNSVTVIGNEAFSGCYGLTDVTIGNSVTSIGSHAFDLCPLLKNLTLGNSLTSIGYAAFMRCESLNTVTIPNSVRQIGDYAFSDCKGLTNLELGSSVESIGSYAFQECENLTSVTIPESVIDIKDYAFYKCYNMQDVVIGNSVITIGKGAFYFCLEMRDLTLGNSITTIGSFAFAFCDSLKGTLNIPASVISIGEASFQGNGYSKVIMHNSVTTIGRFAFASCQHLSEVNLPNSIISIGDHAFVNCGALSFLYSEIEEPASVIYGDEIFNLCPTETCELHVPCGTKGAYRATLPWSQFIHIVDPCAVTYHVSIAETENGTVTANKDEAEEGDEVIVVVTSSEGYVLDNLSVIDDDGNEIEVVEGNDGSYSFVMPANNVTIYAIFLAEDPHNVGWWLILFDNEGNPEWYELAPGSITNYETVLYLESSINGQISDEMPFYFMNDGVTYGAAVDMQEAIIDNPFVNPLYQNNNHYTIPAGFIYLLGVYVDEESGNYYAYVHQDHMISVDEVSTNKEVSSVRYYNVMGQQIHEATGFAIAVTLFTDGTTKIVKVHK